MIEIDSSKLNGEIVAPFSKSYAIRYLILSALIEGKNRINGIMQSKDISDAKALLMASGREISGEAEVQVSSESPFEFSNVRIEGSATAHRIAVALATTFPGRKRIIVGDNLAARPIDPLLISLSKQGVHFSKEGNAIVVDGMLRGTDFEVIGNVSSQYITALLFTAVSLKKEVRVRLTTDAVSKTYLEMTKRSLINAGVEIAVDGNVILANPIGIRPLDVVVPGDFALSSFFAVMAARNGISVRIKNLDPASSGDSMISDIIRTAGARSIVNRNIWEIHENGSLDSLDINLKDCPDLLPPVAALISEARGVSNITGISHLRFKESDRIAETIRLLQQFGVNSSFNGKQLVIKGGNGQRFSYVSQDDHRVAMFALTLANSYGGIIEGEQFISKSYPDFLDEFRKLGGKFIAS